MTRQCGHQRSTPIAFPYRGYVFQNVVFTRAGQTPVGDRDNHEGSARTQGKLFELQEAVVNQTV